MSFFLEGCKVLALRTWLGAGINTAKFQEVLVFDGVFMCQVIDNHCFFQEFKALSDRAFDFHLAKLYLGAQVDSEALLAYGLLAAGQGLDGLVFQAHPAHQHHEGRIGIPDPTQVGVGWGSQQAGHEIGRAHV